MVSGQRADVGETCALPEAEAQGRGDHVHRFVSAMMGRYMPLQVGCSLVEVVELGTTGS